jgi:CheY-like chemotaxis protein
VEDDEDVRFITVTMLRSLGYNVLEAAGGNEALLLLRETENIALLVTDIMLSGPMNGKKVATEAEALQPGIRILYMSGYSENAIIHHGRLDQGVHFIQKPFRKQDMAQKVRQALSHEPD